ncbi:hypothetical protein E1293_39810 [Actinomadura darangshiensis]|uniref:Uncharacterized protein n=1 Tax=Actinomadura darangshiensis TaxID=705336 RepID=A0A4R5A341_9ACTN|nr:hypothetical protein [Actinomadura darangshiensis]TDD65895.1 hypothetical protein E1293_39810 [Actinomadura darangshiensis]
MLTMLVAGGCGVFGGSSDSPAQGAESKTPVTAASTTPVTPADGSDVSACGDGNCAVLVSGPVDIKVKGHGGITMLSVVKVTPPGLSFKIKSDDGTGSGELQPTCTLKLHKYGQATSCGGTQTPPPQETGILALQVASAANGGVVLRLVSGKVGEPPASLRPPKIKLPSLPDDPWGD